MCRDIEEGLYQGTEQRNMRIDPLVYFGDRMFCPGPSYRERPAPGKGFYSGREIQTCEDVLLAEARDFYRMEIWCSAEMSHAGAKYMIYLAYEDERDFIGVKMHSGLKKAIAVCCCKGIVTEIAGMDLSKGYDFGVPHLIGVERKKNCFKVTLDDDKCMEFMAGTDLHRGKIGAKGCFTPVIIHSIIVAEGAELREKELFFLSEFYDCSGAELENNMLKSSEDMLLLTERNGESTVAESFRWKVQREDHQVDLYCEEERLCSVAGIKDMVTFYYYRGSDKACLLTDGRILDKGEMELTEVSGIGMLLSRDQKEGPFQLEARGLALEEYIRIM